ncbi:MAG: hypothetical protein ABIJ56_05040 [Pseudomonadota bacterium]
MDRIRIIAFIALTAFFQPSCEEKDSGTGIAQVDYLAANASSLDLTVTDDFSDLALLDPYVDDNEVFFSAEIHGMKQNYDLRLKFLKYFVSRGVRSCLVELGYGFVQYLGEYLETGDEQLLGDIYAELEGAYAWSHEEFEFWKEVYAFNRTLPEDGKIVLIGIDIEQVFAVGGWRLHDLLPEGDPPESIAPMIAELRRINESGLYDYYTLRTFSSSLQADIEAHAGAYEAYLGQNYFDFRFVARNLVNRYECDAISDEGEWASERDRRIYENFKDIYQNRPQEKYFGQWGRAHVYRRAYWDVVWVASLMDGGGLPVAGKVLSIATFYDNSTAMTTYPYDTAFFSDDSSISMPLDMATDSPVTLFRLVGDDSPFETGQYLLDDSHSGGVTTDYFQFCVFMQFADPTTPLY